MNILMITTNDPAGMGIAFTRAINAYSPHSCRLVTTKKKYNFEYPSDLHVPDLAGRYDELEAVLRSADIFHFHTFSDEETPLGPFRARDFIEGKAVVYHQHGEPLRSRPDYYRWRYRRQTVLVSTPDLLRLLPTATWIPNLVPVDDPLYQPLRDRPNGQVRIGQSPTKTEIKDTALLLAVYADLKGRFNGHLALDIIRDTPHAECLERKRRCHVFFDHMQGYYGVSSLEAMSQGVPTIAGLDAWTRKHVEAFAGTSDLPWLVARSRRELGTHLSGLAADGGLRAERGVAARRFMVERWHPRRVVERLTQVYAGL